MSLFSFLALRVLTVVVGPEELQHLFAHALAIDAELGQHVRGDAFALADQPQQQVFGADVVVAEQPRLFDGQLQHALGARRERNLADGERAAGALDHVLHRLLDLFEVQLELREHLGRDALALAHDAEQQVLGADVVVLEARRFVTRVVDDLAHALRETILHESSCSVLPDTRSGVLPRIA